MRLTFRTLLSAAFAYAVTRLAVSAWKEARYPLKGRVVLITGGSRGLGLLLAREYARRGAKLLLVARDDSELQRAGEELRAAGAEVVALPCDVGDDAQVFGMIERAVARFGRIDIVVNAAGRIEVGPLRSMTVQDFKSAMTTNFWGAFNVTNAVLPHLATTDQRGPRIVNISSIGGLLSVPHLLPYSASKFALTGFSLGLRMELAPNGIRVVTVCPGLMRTGGPIHALFKGDQSAEYGWFSVADSLPLLSMSGVRAARAIVRASQRGDVLLVLGLPAQLARLANALLPASVVRASSLLLRLLPRALDTSALEGGAVPHKPRAWLTLLSDRAAEQNNQLG
jgi:NAD(P)-dependent dehydrogenase (short-subunit alcohol dehydrogenase family)